MLRYYMDHNVTAAITSGLRRRGIDCLTAYEDGFSRRRTINFWIERRN